MIQAKAVIFDMDGVLLDSMYVWEEIGARLLQKRGIAAPDELREILRPMGLEQSADYLDRRFDLHCTPTELVDEMIELTADEYLHHNQLKAGAAELLRLLQEQNIPCCVATATVGSLARAALSRNGALPYLCFVMTCDEVGKDKSDPLIYLQAAERLGVEPQDALVLEDVPLCARTAKKAGFMVAGVYDDWSKDHQDQLKAASDYYITDLAALREMFII